MYKTQINSTINQSDFEKLFISVLGEKANHNCSFLSLPSNTCFSGCIKEILSCLENEMNGIKTHEYSKNLLVNFYDWVLADSLIKEYDFLFYSQLVQKLANYINKPQISTIEKYAFFEYIKNSKINRYRSELNEKIIYCYDNDVCDEKSYESIVSFINEYLAMGNTYPYLSFVLNCYNSGWFSNFKQMMQYLNCANNDTLDILIPLENYSETDSIIFPQEEYKVMINDVVYYKVYSDKKNDFYRSIKENVGRLESTFNFLRFYNGSEIKFSYTLPIKVKSNYFKRSFEVLMSDILCYKSDTCVKKFLNDTMSNLEEIRKSNNEIYRKILNVMNYAEKNRSNLNPSSYIDNWISLETLVSMNERNKSFDAVRKFIPKMISSKLILDDINKKFKTIRSFLNGKNIPLKNLKEFIKGVYNGENYSDYIDDPYVKILTINLMNQLSSIKNLKALFDKVEKELEIDLLRIYILRNEYVHSSNLQAFSSMQPYKLKRILSDSIDEFFKLLSNKSLMKYNSNYSIAFNVFSEALYKYDARATAFSTLIDEKNQPSYNKLHTSIEEQSIKYEEFIMNVLINKTGLFKAFTSKFNPRKCD